MADFDQYKVEPVDDLAEMSSEDLIQMYKTELKKQHKVNETLDTLKIKVTSSKLKSEQAQLKYENIDLNRATQDELDEAKNKATTMANELTTSKNEYETLIMINTEIESRILNLQTEIGNRNQTYRANLTVANTTAGNGQERGVQGSQLSSIPVFTGNVGCDAEAYLEMVERARLQFNWSDEATAYVVQSRMTQEASTWLRAETKFMNDDINSWPLLKKAMLERFSLTVSRMAASHAVKDLTQRMTETVDAFYDRVRLAVDKMNDPYKDKADPHFRDLVDSQVFVFFSAGLLEIYRTSLLGTPTSPTTAKDLRIAAKGKELEMGRSPRELKPLAVGSNSEETGGKEVSAVQKTKRDKSNVTCYYCKQKGHYRNKCYKLKQDKKNNKVQSTQAQAALNTLQQLTGKTWTFVEDENSGNA